MKSYALFYPKFLARLQAAPAFSSRDEAAVWMRDAWCAIHLEFGGSKRRMAIMRGARICKEQGWKDIDKAVCYIQSPDNPPIRLYVHNDGSVVIQHMLPGRSQILLAKPGKTLIPTA